MGNKGNGMHKLTFLLLIIGGLNWLVFAIFNWEIGHIFGSMDAVISKIIYIIIGISAIYELFAHRSSCKHCEVKKEAPPASSEPEEPLATS